MKSTTSIFRGMAVENAEHVSTKEKEILSFIMARVQTEYIFRKQVGNKEQSIETGIFKVSKNELFSSSCNVQWQACYGCAFVMLMSVSENVTLAEHVLAMIVGYATNIFNMVEEGYNQLIAYPDKMVALLHVFLPSGQLIFMNHRLVKQFEKDLDKILSEKK
ncbi:AP-5 complex subunit sigma-1-like isoform X3 [Hydractinia symbiolongicarpus]|uniref:AP-5 complex subunit sigma-1-like isoform X3 n=1 Tax=Hydractinia symbiolongicarpus TaxID=13093 RepID=UPI00254F8CF9|nr:AP-5 complex subunit sigma-1-like isoform X3 [Hydractinia symbiolongicarpus]